MTVIKQGIPVIFNDKGEPVAVIFFSQNRDRIIYMIEKADEEEIISLINTKNDITTTTNNK